jgi:ATP-dependent RNA helicase DeaD
VEAPEPSAALPATPPVRAEPERAPAPRPRARGEGGERGERGQRDDGRAPRDDRRREREARRGTASGVANFRWEPPKEPDDDEPLIETSDTPSYYVESSATPGVTDAPGTVGRGAAANETVPGGDDPVVQLFVNVGTREGVRASDLQRLLTDQGIPLDEVGGIRVRDRMSFVRIRRTLLDRAVAALSGQVIGGRTVVAELARGRG